MTYLYLFLVVLFHLSVKYVKPAWRFFFPFFCTQHRVPRLGKIFFYVTQILIYFYCKVYIKNSILSKKKFVLEIYVQTADLFGKFRADLLISKYAVLVSDLIFKSLDDRQCNYALKYFFSVDTFLTCFSPMLHFLYPRKIWDNIWFSDVFNEYRNWALSWNGIWLPSQHVTCT